MVERKRRESLNEEVEWRTFYGRAQVAGGGKFNYRSGMETIVWWTARGEGGNLR